MHPSWVFWAELGVVALTSTVFLVAGYLLCKRHRPARYVAITIGAACLCYRILTSTFPDRFYIESPYLILTGVITPAGFLLLAAALTVTMKKSRQRVLIGVFSVVLTYYVFCDAAYLAVKGPEISQLAGRFEGETMRQSRPFTCGPAAAASLLRAWGIPAKEGALAYAARTSFRGTELPRLADAIRHFGRYKPLRVKILSITFEELRLRNRPVVLLVRKGRHRHVVTLLRITDNELTIADPGSGTQRFPLAEFGDWYDWNGRAIVAWRDSAFEKRSGEPPDPSLDN